MPPGLSHLASSSSSFYSSWVTGERVEGALGLPPSSSALASFVAVPMERKEGVKEGGVCALWNPALDVCLAPKAAVTKDGGAAGWEMGLRDREDRRQTEEGGGGGRRGCGGWTWREGGRVVWVEEGEEERVLGWKEREGGREGEWRLLTPAEEEKEEKKKGCGDSCRLEVVRHEWMGHDDGGPFRLVCASSLRCLCDCTDGNAKVLCLCRRHLSDGGKWEYRPWVQALVERRSGRAVGVRNEEGLQVA
ncbi:Hypothetical protein NocV09_07400120 [Nannochloropsis oceanica]